MEFRLGKRLEAKEPLWRLTRKWAVQKQWGSMQRVPLDSTWRCGCRDRRVEHLADSQDSGPGGR